MAGSWKDPTIKTIWGLAKSSDLQLSSEELHILVENHTGKEHISKLNKREIKKVVDVLLKMKDSVKRVKRRSHPAYAGNTGTINQRKKIYKLAQELGWSDPSRVNGMCRRLFKIDNVDWLDYEQCSKLIEALKSMLERPIGTKVDK